MYDNMNIHDTHYILLLYTLLFTAFLYRVYCLYTSLYTYAAERRYTALNHTKLHIHAYSQYIHYTLLYYILYNTEMLYKLTFTIL